MNSIEELYKSARSKKLKVQRGTEQGGDCQAKTCRSFLCFQMKVPFQISRPISSFSLFQESKGDTEQCFGEEPGHK